MGNFFLHKPAVIIVQKQVGLALADAHCKAQAMAAHVNRDGLAQLQHLVNVKALAAKAKPAGEQPALLIRFKANRYIGLDCHPSHLRQEHNTNKCSRKASAETEVRQKIPCRYDKGYCWS